MAAETYDAIEEYETMWATVMDELKWIYFLKNVNEKIFKQTLVLWHNVLTRKSFPDIYDILKASIMNECLSQMTQPEHTKIIHSVIIHIKRKTGTIPQCLREWKRRKRQVFG
jgi:hypothetical protein